MSTFVEWDGNFPAFLIRTVVFLFNKRVVSNTFHLIGKQLQKGLQYSISKRKNCLLEVKLFTDELWIFGIFYC